MGITGGHKGRPWVTHHPPTREPALIACCGRGSGRIVRGRACLCSDGMPEMAQCLPPSPAPLRCRFARQFREQALIACCGRGSGRIVRGKAGSRSDGMPEMTRCSPPSPAPLRCRSMRLLPYQPSVGGVSRRRRDGVAGHTRRRCRSRVAYAWWWGCHAVRALPETPRRWPRWWVGRAIRPRGSKGSG